MLYKIRQFIKYFFMFEKVRYYSGGALRGPVPITQKFWDELTERRRCIKEDPYHRGGDMNYGNDDLGQRPKTPDWVFHAKREVRFWFGIVSFIVMVAIIARNF